MIEAPITIITFFNPCLDEAYFYQLKEKVPLSEFLTFSFAGGCVRMSNGFDFELEQAGGGRGLNVWRTLCIKK